MKSKLRATGQNPRAEISSATGPDARRGEKDVLRRYVVSTQRSSRACPAEISVRGFCPVALISATNIVDMPNRLNWDDAFVQKNAGHDAGLDLRPGH